MKFTTKILFLATFLVACGVAIRTQIPFEFDEIKDIKIVRVKDDGDYQFLFKPSATRRTIRQVIRFLPENGSLFLFDGTHKKISDPGAYATLVRMDTDKFAVKYANHGWQSKWFVVSEAEATEYLWVCKADNAVNRKHNMLTGGMHFAANQSFSQRNRVLQTATMKKLFSSAQESKAMDINEGADLDPIPLPLQCVEY